MTLLPGLIDAHLHSTNNNRILYTILKNGVTTLRDPGNPFRSYQALSFAKEKELELAAKENVVLSPTLATFERRDPGMRRRGYQAIGLKKCLSL